MGIAPDDIDRVRSQTDVVAVISEHVGLRKQGSRWVGLCPFHAEKSGSFSVNQEMGLFYCFGCQAKGDVITFVREILHLDFPGAVEHLAGRLGIELHYDSSTEDSSRKQRRALVEVMNKAVDWYHERLLTSPDAAKARGYLRSRGYDGEVVRTYKLGWAPDGWDTLCKALKVPQDHLRDTGLGFVNSRNRMQDALRARVLFPIFDARGDAVAVGGRILPGGEGSKYKNSPSTAIYDKSDTLYGLNWAKGPAVANNEIVVCEGYTDVIGMGQAGVEWAVATCGTALTDRHFATLKNFSRRIVLAYDADAAGQGAAERFYEWEKRHDVDVYVAALPPGADPGDLARTDPAALQLAVKEAQPFLAFRLRRLLASANLSTVEGRARAAEQAMAMVAEHPNELVRDQYVMEIADRCRVEPERLRSGLVQPRRAAPAPEPRRPGRVRADRPSLQVLRLAVHHPELVAHLLDEVLFTDAIELGAYRALASAATFHEAIEAADPESAELLQRLAVEEVDVEADDVLSLLVGEAAQRALREVDAEARVSSDPLAAAETVAWLKLRLEESREAATRGPALEQLVAFLVGRRREEGNDR
jgi:DNA primase